MESLSLRNATGRWMREAQPQLQAPQAPQAPQQSFEVLLQRSESESLGLEVTSCGEKGLILQAVKQETWPSLFRSKPFL